jgi:3-methyladenine DNA glycosylase AlkD
MTTAPILARLSALASDTAREELARYGIPADYAIGVPMGAIKRLARDHGTDHALACELWPTGGYEARILAIHLADPVRTMASLMDSWTGDFDNWALCDTAAFQLFDKTAERWAVTERWCASEVLYTRRTGLAMIWALSVHDKVAPDQTFLTALDWIEAVATDHGQHVHAAASMALRATGKRNVVLQGAALQLCNRLTESPNRTAAKLGRASARALQAPGAKNRG